MRFIDKAWYRSFQMGMNIGSRALYWRKPITVEGEGALSKAPELFKKNHVKKVMIVTGRTVGKTIAPIAKAAPDAKVFSPSAAVLRWTLPRAQRQESCILTPP